MSSSRPGRERHKPEHERDHRGVGGLSAGVTAPGRDGGRADADAGARGGPSVPLTGYKAKMAAAAKAKEEKNAGLQRKNAEQAQGTAVANSWVSGGRGMPQTLPRAPGVMRRDRRHSDSGCDVALQAAGPTTHVPGRCLLLIARPAAPLLPPPPTSRL